MIQWGVGKIADNTFVSYTLPFTNQPVVIVDSARYGYCPSIGGSNVSPTETGFKFYSRYFDLTQDPSPGTVMFWVAYGLWKPLEAVSVDMTATIKGNRIYDNAINAYKRIPFIQSGYNNNRYWMEFNDGLMIQWGKTEIQGNTEVFYAREFSSDPVVFCSIPRASYRVTTGVNNIQPSTTSFIPEPRKLVDNTLYTNSTTLHWLAYGRSR